VIHIVTPSGDGSAFAECPWLARYRFRARLLDARATGKRCFDILISAIGLLLCLPVLLLAVAAIKVMSPRHPVLFVQERTGYRGRRFKLYKLRTMVVDAEARKAELGHLNARRWPDFKIERDPRITRVGRILRATSIDELPQLVNVLRGDMSLVGPRPTSRGVDGFTRWPCERFEVNPGQTGLWQVTARDSSSFDHRIRLDIAYLTHQSLRLDLAILARTVPVVLLGRGAT
jgi:lipopolysaccharide/colanic/teichoic acid biosynthesis glycosyltransferase